MAKFYLTNLHPHIALKRNEQIPDDYCGQLTFVVQHRQGKAIGQHFDRMIIGSQEISLSYPSPISNKAKLQRLYEYLDSMQANGQFNACDESVEDERLHLHIADKEISVRYPFGTSATQKLQYLYEYLAQYMKV